MSNWRDYFQDLSIVSIPTKTDFRGITAREIAIFKGEYGWSEFSPFLEYGALESSNWARAALEAVYFPKAERIGCEVLVNATLPIVPLDQVEGILNLYPGVNTVKMKINSFAEARERIVKTISVIPGTRLRFDVNGLWTLEQAIENCKLLVAEFGEYIEYIEQPTLEFDDLRKLKDLDLIKIGIDEGIRKHLNFDFSTLNQFGDYAILKHQPIGGARVAREIAETANLPIVLSSALESSIGIYQSIALACEISDPKVANGLATTALLQSDLMHPGAKVVDGKIKYQTPIPDQTMLEKYQVNPEKRIWWEKRIEEVWLEYLLPNSKRWGWDFL
jgi:O-succinylbenzoate synthase